MTDADRDRTRRLQLARAQALSRRRPVPSPAQLQAAGDAWTRVSRAFGALLPRTLDLRWTHGDDLEPGFPREANAAISLSPRGTPIVVLRVDRSPASIRRSMTHEAIHAAHFAADPTASRADMETIAERLTAQLCEVARDVD